MKHQNRRYLARWIRISNSTISLVKRNASQQLSRWDQHYSTAITCGCLSLQTRTVEEVSTCSIPSSSWRDSFLSTRPEPKLSSSRTLLRPTTYMAYLLVQLNPRQKLRQCLLNQPALPLPLAIHQQWIPRTSSLMSLSCKSISRGHYWLARENLISDCGSWSPPNTSATTSKRGTFACQARNMTWIRLITCSFIWLIMQSRSMAQTMVSLKKAISYLSRKEPNSLNDKTILR